MTVRVFSDQAGTTAAAANDNIGKVEDLSKFDSDGVSSTTGPYLSVDANGFGSADILGQGGDVVQTFTNAIAGGSALIVGTSKCIFFSNVNVEAGGTLTIGPAGDMINTNGLNLIGKVVSVATTTKVLTTAEQNSIATFFAERGASSVVVNDETVYDVNSVEADLVLDFNGSSFYRNVPHYFKLGGSYSTFAEAFMGNSPKLTYNPGSASTSQSTMVNSSGEIVWAPHNLVPYSEDPSDWNADDVTLTTSGVSDPNGGTNAATFTLSSADSVHANWDNLGAGYDGLWITVGAYLKVGSGTRYFSVGHWQALSDNCGAGFDLEAGIVTGTGSIGTDQAARNGAIQNLGGGWFYCSVEVNFPTATFYPAVSARTTSYTSGSILESWTPAGTETYSIYGFHAYRSDLGGMAPVPGAATGFETYVPTNGAAEYLPRVGHHVYNGSAWVNEGLLIESEARTNLITGSNDLTTSPWADGNTLTSVTQNVTGPDDKTSGWTLLADTVNAGHYLYNDLAFSISAADYTLSFYLKYSNHQWATIRFRGGDGTNYHANFDLLNSVQGSSTSGVTTFMEDAGNGWYRCGLTATSAGSGTVNAVMVALNSADNLNTNPWTPAGTEEIYVYGAQLEQASTPSSYIPTNGSTVTRGGQSLTVPANWYDVDNPTYTSEELVTNGGFATDTVWTKGTGWTINTTTGVASHAAGSSGNLDQSMPLVTSAAYEVRLTLSNVSAGQAQVYLQGSAAENVSAPLNSNGDYSFTLVAGTATSYDLRVNGSSTFVGSIDNVSVRQVSAPQFGWPEPEVIGPELVTTTAVENGGWTVSETTVTATGTSGAADNVVFTLSEALEVGKVYQILIPNNMPVFGFYVDTVGGSAQIGALDATNDYIIVKCTSPTSSLRVGRWVGTPTGTIGPISVREIDPLSVSIQMDGRMTYADDDVDTTNPSFAYWDAGSNNYIHVKNNTYGASITGRFDATQDNGTGSAKASVSGNTLFAPGVLVPFNISSRHGSTFVNGAVDGVALTEDTTPTALPDLSNTDLQIAYDFMGTIGTFRQFSGDIGDVGLVTATKPSTEPTLSLTFDGTGGSFYSLNWSE